MTGERRHTEFFGPDLARGPVLSGSPQTAAFQLAAALAQLRAPLSRSADELRAHADFIRELADRLMPDWAAGVQIDVDPLVNRDMATSILVPTHSFNLLNCWLADGPGGAVTATAPDAVAWTVGTVLQTLVPKRHFVIVTPHTGVAAVTVTHATSKTWFWAVARYGRVYYSSALIFP